MLTTLLGCAVLPLLILSFGLQYYIGQRVYWRQSRPWAKSLNFFRTFRLGWQNLDLYPFMIVWTLVLAAAVLVAVMVCVFQWVVNG